MNKLLKITSWLSVIFLIAGSRILIAGEKSLLDVKLMLNKDTLNWCADESTRNFVLTIDIGTMTNTDSLYGYNFQINYDSTKVVLSDLLTIGTLSENCDFKSGGNDTLGHFRASAMMMGMTPMTGEGLPLVAVKGYLKENCYEQEDSVDINLEYLEFTNEFVYDSVNLENRYFPIRKNQDIPQSQYLKLRVLNDSMNLNDAVPTLNLYIEKPDLDIHSISFSIDYSALKDYLNFENGLTDSVRTNSTGEISTSVTDSQDDSYVAKISITNANTFIRGDRITVYLKKQDTIYTEESEKNLNLFVTPLDLEECNCIAAYLPDSVNVTTFTKVSVDEAKSNLNEYDFDGQTLNFKDDFDKVTIYDIRGGTLLSKCNVFAGENLHLNSYLSGVFFAVLEKNKTTKRILIIKH